MLTLIIFLIVLGTLVFVHELGHFLVARRNGVIAEEFGFGFPPRVAGVYKNKEGKWKVVMGNKEIGAADRKENDTVYSINLIPLGGFVKIKGEDGADKDDPTSFAAQSVWKRFKILSAGVAMNFVLGIVLLSITFMLGMPEAVGEDEEVQGGKIQVAQVMPKSPAEEAGLQLGDEIIAATDAKGEVVTITSVQQFQTLTKENAGKEMSVQVRRPESEAAISIEVMPRETTPEGEGPLGIALAKTLVKQYGFFESVWLAVKTTGFMIVAILSFLGDLLVKIFTAQPVSTDVAGPVGIAILTGDAARLGLVYVLHLAAMLSINLGVINFFPFPALDGGRVLFLFIEKLKGSPVSQKIEGLVHTAGFVFLLAVMVLVTVKDFNTFEILSKIKGIF